MAEVIDHLQADVLFLQGFDYDLTGEALTRFAALTSYPHSFALPPNSGRQTGLDVDNDGRLGEPEDALGFGRFFGEGGMALLSRLPVMPDSVVDHSGLLWRDLPRLLLPAPSQSAWPTPDVHATLPLASVAHWQLALDSDAGPLTLLMFHASPPVFDGQEDRNGRRNHDQLMFWQMLLDGELGPAPTSPFVLLGDANQDPTGGDGRNEAIRALLADPRLQDPAPEGAEGTRSVDWEAIGVGKLRVSYILPSADLSVSGAGVLWPEPGGPLASSIDAASRHRPVWVDLDLSGQK